MKRASIRWTAFAGAVAACVSACGGSGERPETTQVVARVNDAEITISQLRAALVAKGEAAPTPEATQQALEGLVNEQLLVNAALQSELDRDPTVVQAIESARRQLLARAYLERVVLPKQEITAAEQTAYYKANPALFAQRRVYQLTTYTCGTDKLEPGVVEKLGEAPTPLDVAAVLAANHLDCATQNVMRAAEQLPLEQLPQFAAADVGDVIIQPAQNERTTLLLVTAIQNSPIGLESAQPIIQQYLANVRNAEALDAHLKQARAAASITHSDASLLAATTPPPAPVAEPQDTPLQHGAAVLN
jgi:EpsD family peptidyl-prolyl cis-trans isomerase